MFAVEGLEDRKIIPQIAEPELRRVLAQVYLLESISEIVRLSTYEDLAYIIKLNDGDSLIFKVVNEDDSAKTDTNIGIDELMHHLSASGLNVPVPLAVPSGGAGDASERTRYHTVVKLNYKNGSQGEHIVRLLKMIPGEMMVKAHPYTPQLLREVGEIVGRLHHGLRSFGKRDCFLRPQFLWSLSNLQMIRPIITKLFANDPKRASLVSAVIDAFETHVHPHQALFCEGLIHGDLNEQNILVDVQKEHVHAIIDFGDSHHSFYVYDIASCISYMALDAPEDLILDAGKHVLATYLPVFSLTPLEQSVLPYCVAGRLIQSLVLALNAASNLPPNDIKLEHILITQRRGWYVLEKLWDYGAEKLAELWT